MISKRLALTLLVFLAASAASGQYDGSWSGMTSQSKPISFQIQSNAYTELEFGGRITGSGCTADFNVEVTYTTPKPLTGSTISLVSTTSAPGAISYNISGTFTSTTTASGSMTFTMNSIPGVPSCSGSGSATWSMTKSGGSSCSYSISPQQHTGVSASGGTGSVTVTGTPSGCSGSWTATSGASWIAITSGSSGSGAGPATVSYSVAPNTTSSQRTGTLTIAGSTFTVTQMAPSSSTPTLSQVLAVLGSLPGNFGSYFKTSVQMHNRGSSLITGRLVYHPAGASGSGSDPSFDFSLAPGQTIDYTDLLPAMSLGGLGTLDVLTIPGQEPPLVLARIYNDAGSAGTTGMAIEAVPIADALQAGDEGVLLAPIDPSKSRLNIGVRTLSEGASVMVRVIDRNGITRTTLSKSWGATFFEQKTSDQFTGLTLNASDAVIITVNSGSAFFYGSTTDNTTQDPAIQWAKPRF